VNTEPLHRAVDWIEHHRKFWEGSFDRLETLLKKPVRSSKLKSKPKR
jgi:hypothetical protein